VRCWAQACRWPEGLQLSKASLRTYEDDRLALSSSPFGRYDLLQAVGKCIAYLEAFSHSASADKRARLLDKSFCPNTILFARNWPRHVDGLRKVLVECLLPRSPVLSLQHVLELHEGVNPGEFAFLCSLIKLGDCLVDGELDGVTSVILVNVNKVFVFGIVATQLVDFRQGVVVIPFLFALVERGPLIDGCPCVVFVASRILMVVLVASRILLDYYGASHVLRDAARPICYESITFHAILL
jgi:hypothetical protein